MQDNLSEDVCRRLEVLASGSGAATCVKVDSFMDDEEWVDLMLADMEMMDNDGKLEATPKDAADPSVRDARNDDTGPTIDVMSEPRFLWLTDPNLADEAPALAEALQTFKALPHEANRKLDWKLIKPLHKYAMVGCIPAGASIALVSTVSTGVNRMGTHIRAC